MMPDLEQITEEVRRLAVETGGFLREERKRFRRECVEEKNAHDYVSYVDRESERRIVERLRQLLPEAGFITEEGTAGRTDGESCCWVVDPLDGTTNYIHDNAPYCVSIALRDRKELLAGVVYEVCRDECYWAWKGAPAFLNGREIQVSSVSDPDRAFIELGFPYAADRYREFVRSLIGQLYGRVGGLRLQGSAAAELCYIAAGRFEARVEALLGAWDVAAGAVILRQAGGMITDFEGGGEWETGKQVVATNGKMHEYLLKIISGL